MSVEYTKKTWYDGSEGGTPITAAELNRVETGIDDVVTQSNADKTNIDNHTASKVNSSSGAHGLRYYSGELDYYDDTNEEWVKIQTGGGGTSDYEDLTNLPSVNGVELLGNKTIGLLSGNIQVDSANIGYDNSDSDLSATNTKSAIDELASTRAIKTLSNIQNTTTTDVEYRYSNTGKEFIADDWNFVNGKYINIKSENNVIYAVVSEDGYTVTNKVATNLPSDIGYVFQNPNSNVYFAICVVSGAKVSIFYSSDLATWTKVILPNSEGTEPEQGIYKYKMNYVSKPISYTLWGDTCIVIGLGYRQYEDGEGIMQTDYTSIITARNGNDFAIANSNLGSFNENLDTSVFYQYYNTPNYYFVLSSYTSTDGLTYTKYTLPDDRSPQYVAKVESNYFIWGTDYTNHTCAVFSTSDFSTFTKVYDFYPSTWQEHPEFSDYFDEVNRVLFKNDTYFVLGSNYDSEHDTFKAAIVAIPSTFTNREWCDLPNGEYNFNPDRSKATVYDYTNGAEYNLLNISPFTAEVSKALTILDVGSGSGGGSGTDDYEDLLNKPSINGVELLGNKAIGTLSGDIQVEYANLLNKPSINGVELLGNKLVGLLSTDIHINADDIGYSGTVSGASTTRVAIDALQSSLSGLHGIPSGGNTNQVLAKNSSSDYDLKWVNQTGGGSGFKIIVTASTYPNKSVTVTESDSGDTVTETTDANGVATFIVSAGTWTATTLVSGVTVTLGSVTVGTTSIEYYSNVNFAFHYSENDSSPDSVTYPSGYDNSDWSSDTAYMDYTNDTFHYGNWNPSGTHAAMLSWLFPKPCMLKSDGTVDYYLDPNDYTKKADGTASDIANTSYDGNAMMEWGQNGAKIYWKIIPDNDNKGFTFCVANSKLDEDYDCWNHYDCDNNIKDHFYTPIYFGSLVSNKLRSLSGRANSVNTTRQNEIDYATANNTGSKVHWYTEVYSDWLLQGMLTTLITKSLDSQTKIGKGVTSASAAINTGTMNTKGLFWGSTNGTDGVKCWGMENTWGNLYRAIGGLIASTQTIKVKLTPNNHDDTTATSYNTDGTGYTTANTLSGSSGYISHMYATKKSLTPATLSGSESTYYCDRCYTTTTANTYYALVGGYWGSTAYAGAFCVVLDYVASRADTARGAALSYK